MAPVKPRSTPMTRLAEKVEVVDMRFHHCFEMFRNVLIHICMPLFPGLQGEYLNSVMARAFSLDHAMQYNPQL